MVAQVVPFCPAAGTIVVNVIQCYCEPVDIVSYKRLKSKYTAAAAKSIHLIEIRIKSDVNGCGGREVLAEFPVDAQIALVVIFADYDPVRAADDVRMIFPAVIVQNKRIIVASAECFYGLRMSLPEG